MNLCHNCIYANDTECRRFPPTLQGFPPVYPLKTWCGEWRDKNAGKIESTKRSDGDSGASPGKAVQTEQRPEKNDEITASRLRIDQGKGITEEKSQEKTQKVAKRGWPKGKSRK